MSGPDRACLSVMPLVAVIVQHQQQLDALHEPLHAPRVDLIPPLALTGILS